MEWNPGKVSFCLLSFFLHLLELEIINARIQIKALMTHYLFTGKSMKHFDIHTYTGNLVGAIFWAKKKKRMNKICTNEVIVNMQTDLLINEGLPLPPHKEKSALIKYFWIFLKTRSNEKCMNDTCMNQGTSVVPKELRNT